MKDLRNLKLTMSFFIACFMFMFDISIVVCWENILVLIGRMIFIYLAMSFGQNMTLIYIEK